MDKNLHGSNNLLLRNYWMAKVASFLATLFLGGVLGLFLLWLIYVTVIYLASLAYLLDGVN